MEIIVNVDGLQKRVVVTRQGTGYTVKVGDRDYHVGEVSSIGERLAFLVERRSYIARVSNGREGTRLSLGGHTYHVMEESRDADRPGPSHRAAGDGKLEAPMPGTIVSVRVSEGDTVAAGEPVIVLESMKMQNEIVSPVAGVVRRIHCAEGAQVGFGDLLAIVEALG